jgi:hypothetical protein
MTRALASCALASALLASPCAYAVDGKVPPPPQYDHPYEGTVIVKQYPTVASLREACGVPTAVGCILSEDGKTCVIARVDDRTLFFNKWTQADIAALGRGLINTQP